VNWSTLKDVSNNVQVSTLANGFIPRGVKKYLEGGLGSLRMQIAPPSEYHTSDSSADRDSDVYLGHVLYHVYLALEHNNVPKKGGLYKELWM